jgi:nicotinamidase-related amidase
VPIAGVSINNSVEASACTADNLEFVTIVVSDATLTFDKVVFGGTKRSAEDLHLMALANLHDEYAEVMACKEVLRRFELPADPV